MKKTIKMPAPQLSWLKEVNIDLDMTGRHYALLASCKGRLPEEVALSILKDLVEEDANKLTLAELRYLFMLVKINNLEDEYIIIATCQHHKKDGTICNHDNKVKVFISDADLNPTSSDYEPPKIKFRKNNTEKEYSVLEPPIKRVVELYEYFQNDRGATSEDIENDDELKRDFSMLYSLLHLYDSEGNPFVEVNDNFSDLIDTGYMEDGKTLKPSVININKFTSFTKLLEYTLEVDGYGVQTKEYDITCEECGGRIIFQLPLLHGLVD